MGEYDDIINLPHYEPKEYREHSGARSRCASKDRHRKCVGHFKITTENFCIFKIIHYLCSRNKLNNDSRCLRPSGIWRETIER